MKQKEILKILEEMSWDSSNSKPCCLNMNHRTVCLDMNHRTVCLNCFLNKIKSMEKTKKCG